MGKHYNIVTDYQATGNPVVDAVARCIIEHRKRNIALKTIYLKEPLYSVFKTWVYKNMDRPLEHNEELMFDHVNIDKGSKFQINPISVERFDDFNRNMKSEFAKIYGRN